MPAKKLVNLDALIRRQDLDVTTEANPADSGGDVPISELQFAKLHYKLLRKPDFQRETDDWDIDNVVRFIKSVRDGDLIPALIMWRAPSGFLFVIDGAHRLSALIAWINDDYGAGLTSREFFGDRNSANREAMARECRERVLVEVGSYATLTGALDNPKATPEQIRWASNLSKALVTQWVPGNARNAEDSFLAINQRSVPIDETETLIIKSRTKPNAIGARALIRCATGFQYSTKFPSEIKEQIAAKARKIYDVLFEPENAEISETLELPIAGKPYYSDALRLTLDIVNYANDKRSKTEIAGIPDDVDGSQTLRYLERTYGVVKYLGGKNPASLGLHSGVYFWSSSGKHSPGSLLAAIGFIQFLDAKNELLSFTEHRAEFEEFLVTRSVVKHIQGSHGGWRKSTPAVLEMYKLIFEGLKARKSFDQIEQALVDSPRFKNLGELLQLEHRAGANPTRATKDGVMRRTLLESAPRCAICKARLMPRTSSQDHDLRKVDGGKATEENLNPTHHYCNHGFKEFYAQQGLPLPAISWP